MNAFSFPNAAVDRIVPNEKNEDKLLVKVEPFFEWVVEESAIIGENPPVKGITFVQNLEPYIERKLYTVNTGHATAAYFGYLAGIEIIHEALANEEMKASMKMFYKKQGNYSLKNIILMRKSMTFIFKKSSDVLQTHLYLTRRHGWVVHQFVN